VPLEPFSGRDGSGGVFTWLVDNVPALGNILAVKIDVGGDGASSLLGPAAPLPSYTPPDTALGAAGATTGTVGTSSATLIAANAARKRIDISNSSTTAQVWIKPGGGTAAVGTGWLLPPQAQATYFTTLALSAISTVAATVVGIVEW
jgi:hypothetical protein